MDTAFGVTWYNGSQKVSIAFSDSIGKSPGTTNTIVTNLIVADLIA